MTELLDPMDMSEDDVVRFLKQRPHFFEEHPNLLKKLHLKHDSGGVVSLIERQNHILRKENTDLIDRLNHFISIAQRNDKLFINLQALVLDLIACRSLNEICQTLNDGLTQRFEVDHVQVVLTHRLNTDGDQWLYCDKSSLAEHFNAAVNERRNLCGEFNEAARNLLFANQPVKSIAVGALTRDGEGVGIVALGSHSETHFRSGTDTLFLGHLAKVISQLLITL